MEENEKEELEMLRRRVAELEAGQQKSKPKAENKIDWHRLMLRKDRPLPKRGCSWAFYAMLLILLTLIGLYFIDNSRADKSPQATSEITAHE
ncbi:MAG: hypothetical protein K5864_06410 [Bacteroidales bacterium]|nr:hypothetical protein [Bacteroidales bacterium]